MDLDELKKLQEQLLEVGQEERLQETEETESSTFQALSFDMGMERFAVRLTEIREVVKPPKIFKVPSTPAHIPGLINLRGDILCVIDLRKKMGLEDAPAGGEEDARVIVIRRQGSPVGLLVDRIQDALDLKEHDVHPLPSGQFSDCLEGETRINNEVIRLLKVAEVIRKG